MMESISSEIVELIPRPPGRVPDRELGDNINADQFTDMLLGIGNLKIASGEAALRNLETIEAIDNLELKAMVMAGIGGVQTYIGNYSKASTAFHRALELASNPEAVAYVFSEMSSLLRKLGYASKAVTVIDEALESCKNEGLVWQLRWQKALCYKYASPELAMKMLEDIASHYKIKNDLVQYARMKRHMGDICSTAGDLQDFDKADSHYNEAMEVAVEMDALHIQYEIMNDRGWTWYLQGRIEQARSLFLGLIKKDLWPYEMALALQNLGVLEFSRNNFREAIHFHSQSLQLTTQYEMWDLAVEDYYKLGLSHEKLGITGLANHFYSLGYEHVMKEVEMGLPVMGYRKKILKAYVNLLKRSQRVPHVDVRDEIFGFSTNRSLNEIRDVFRKSLLTLHLERTENARELCERLEITPRTYFLYQKKLGLKRGSTGKDPLYLNPHFTQYVEALAGLSWRRANRKFEEDLFPYLLEKHENNRRKLAEALDISYAQAVLKTQPAE
ncbi:MAG: hypothetical protein ACE5HZ_06640 [Fidelibacterota bacterium]